MPRYYKDRIFTETEKQKINDKLQKHLDNKWLKAYDEEWQKTTPEYIENKFRIIRKQSKSK